MLTFIRSNPSHSGGAGLDLYEVCGKHDLPLNSNGHLYTQKMHITQTVNIHTLHFSLTFNLKKNLSNSHGFPLTAATSEMGGEEKYFENFF